MTRRILPLLLSVVVAATLTSCRDADPVAAVAPPDLTPRATAALLMRTTSQEPTPPPVETGFSPRAQDASPGPEVDGLRLLLEIVNQSDGTGNGYDVRLSVLNARSRPVTLAADWTHDAYEGDFETWCYDKMTFVSDPVVAPPDFQTATIEGAPRTRPQPTRRIEPNGAYALSWHVDRPLIGPPGAFDRASRCGVAFASNGRYLVRATLPVRVERGRRIELVSNSQEMLVGGSDAAPKPSLARVVEADCPRGVVRLDVGRADGVEPGDAFRFQRTLDEWYDVVVTSVDSRTCEATVEKRALGRDPEPSCLGAGAEVRLLTFVERWRQSPP